MVTEGFSRLQQSPSGYSGLQQVTAGRRMVTLGDRRLQQVSKWLQWVTAGYSGLQHVTASYRVVTVGYIRL